MCDRSVEEDIMVSEDNSMLIEGHIVADRG